LVFPLLLAGFSTDIFLGNNPEIGHRRADPGPSSAADGAKKQCDAASASAVPQIVIDTQLQHWIRWTLENNIVLAAALKRLQDSYKLLQAGKPAKHADAILAEVEAALKTVEKGSM
jgi:hypothetical protein